MASVRIMRQMGKADPDISPASAHLQTVERSISEWDTANSAVLGSLTNVMNATLSASDVSLATIEPGATLEELHARKQEARADVHEAWAKLQAKFGDLAAQYRNIKAGCESVLNSMEAMSSQPRPLQPPSEASQPAASAAGGAGDSASPHGTGEDSWAQRSKRRAAELLDELLEGYAAQLSLTLAVITRMRPWPDDAHSPSRWPIGHGGSPGLHDEQQDGMDGRVTADVAPAGATRPQNIVALARRPPRTLPSFTVHPGLPPWASSDRQHLTALASTIAIPPYVDSGRVKAILEAVGLIIKGL